MKNSIVKNVLDRIEKSITRGVFENVESEIVELKDLSTGTEWISLKESINAFLNTHDGIIITGIREREGKYTFPGYNEKNLQKYLGLRHSFTDDDGRSLDLVDQLHFEIHQLLDRALKVIYISSVSDDLKYILFNNIAFERKSCADIKVSEEKIKVQKQYKIEELPYRKEILPVINSVIEDLDIGKLNDYIQLLNKEVKIQNLFSENDYQGIRPFLDKRSFVKDNEVTYLGMLVCGKEPFRFLEFKCEVDCFVDSEMLIASNKKDISDTVISLMEESYRFVTSNIQVGVSLDKSGSKIHEYPLQVNISIKPNKNIEIKNPGKFKDKLIIREQDETTLIRRIIPGNTITQNPKLAAVLKVFAKWEGKGLGMATLLNTCLENNIDLSFYKISLEEIALVIPKGQLLNEKSKFWLRSYRNYIKNKLGEEQTSEQEIVLSYLFKSELLNQEEKYTILLTSDNDHYKTISSLLTSGLIYKSKCSHSLYPIYLVDRVLVKRNFSNELKVLFGSDYEYLNSNYKKALNIIYRYSRYNSEPITAKAVADELFVEEKESGSKYTTFVRKISDYCSKMSSPKMNLLIKKKGYSINFDFKIKDSLF